MALTTSARPRRSYDRPHATKAKQGKPRRWSSSRHYYASVFQTFVLAGLAAAFVFGANTGTRYYAYTLAGLALFTAFLVAASAVVRGKKLLQADARTAASPAPDEGEDCDEEADLGERVDVADTVPVSDAEPLGHASSDLEEREVMATPAAESQPRDTRAVFARNMQTDSAYMARIKEEVRQELLASDHPVAAPGNRMDDRPPTQSERADLHTTSKRQMDEPVVAGSTGRDLVKPLLPSTGVHKETVDLGDIIATARSQAVNHTGGGTIDLRINTADNASVYADRAGIVDAMTHLITAAIELARHGHRGAKFDTYIDIRCEVHEQDELRLAVSINGLDSVELTRSGITPTAELHLCLARLGFEEGADNTLQIDARSERSWEASVGIPCPPRALAAPDTEAEAEAEAETHSPVRYAYVN